MARAVALAFILYLGCLAACSGAPTHELPAAPSRSERDGADSLTGVDPQEPLPADPQLEEFFWRAQFLLRRLSAHASTREEMQRALRAGPAGFAHLVRMSPAELSGRMDTLRWQGAVLLRRYPELSACLLEIEREEGPPCDPSDAVELVQDMAPHARVRLRRDDLPYVASLILSAATGNPILYFVGSALATRRWGGG